MDVTHMPAIDAVPVGLRYSVALRHRLNSFAPYLRQRLAANLTETIN